MANLESVDEAMMRGRARAYNAVDGIKERFYAEQRKRVLQDIMLAFPEPVREKLVELSPEAKKIMDQLGG